MYQNSLSWVLSFFIVFSFFSCADNNQGKLGSETKVIGGLDATEGQFPEVVRIQHGSSGCSASFVSQRTLLTAAHCLEGNSGPVTVGDKKTNLYYMHPKYSSRWWEHDIAVVHFAEDVSDVFVTVGNSAPAKDDVLTIVGFGTNDLYGQGTFKKRYGYNKVEKVAQGRITFRGKDLPEQAPAGEDVLSGSGDSGGAMFVNGVQVGVCSAISVEDRGQGRNGYYTDINHGPNRQFLEDLVASGRAEVNW